MKKLLIVLSVASLFGCSGMMMDQAKSDCSAIGYTVGSSEYIQCVDNKYSSSKQAVDKWLYQSNGGGNSSGYAYQRPVQTTCTRNGMFTNCTTN